MNTEPSVPQGSGHAKPHSSPQPSPLRLVILSSVLAVFAGALIYDWVIAPPRVKAANEKLHEVALKHNEFSLKSVGKREGIEEGTGANGGLLYSADIQRILGMAPAKVEKHELYTIEHYRWWGAIPRNQNYITVLYIGPPDNPHYSTHYANEMPEDGAIPGKLKPAEYTGEQSSASGAAVTAMPAAGMPAMAPPGMNMPAGGGGIGKGKGRPQGKGDKGGSEPKGGAEGEKKADDAEGSDEPKKTAESAKAVEPRKETADEGDNKGPAK